MHRVYPHQVWPHDGASYQSLRRAAPRPAFTPSPTLVSRISSRLSVLSVPWKRLPTISDFHLLSLGQPSVLRAAFFTAEHSVLLEPHSPPGSQDFTTGWNSSNHSGLWSCQVGIMTPLPSKH